MRNLGNDQPNRLKVNYTKKSAAQVLQLNQWTLKLKFESQKSAWVVGDKLVLLCYSFQTFRPLSLSLTALFANVLCLRL